MTHPSVTDNEPLRERGGERPDWLLLSDLIAHAQEYQRLFTADAPVDEVAAASDRMVFARDDILARLTDARAATATDEPVSMGWLAAHDRVCPKCGGDMFVPGDGDCRICHDTDAMELGCRKCGHRWLDSPRVARAATSAEPVAWALRWRDGIHTFSSTRRLDVEAEARAIEHRRQDSVEVIPLYASPAPHVAALSGCPCTLVEPCSEQCSCAHPSQSGGCQRCALYGSQDQRVATATRLASLREENERLTAQAVQWDKWLKEDRAKRDDLQKQVAALSEREEAWKAECVAQAELLATPEAQVDALREELADRDRIIARHLRDVEILCARVASLKRERDAALEVGRRNNSG